MTRPPSDERATPPTRPAARRLGAVATALVLLLTLAYPFAVALGLGRVEPRWFALALVGLALLRAAVSRQALWWVAALGAGLLAALSLAGQGWLPLKLYPVLVNAVLLAVFGTSLWRGPPVVERLARLAEPGLPPEGVAYTRRVTEAWCLFFVLNGAAAAATALWCTTEAWALYNGFVAYLLIGAMFGGEWLLRRRLKARLAGAAHG
ncbi:MAG: hypothetical protein U1F53_21245 [Burkholderiaceae bacterium]